MSQFQKFALDILEAAILGAAIAAVGLPDSVTAKEAVGLIAGGAVGAVKGFARLFLAAWIASKNPA